MALQWSDYLHCVDHFLSISESVGDGWCLIEKVPGKMMPDNCYLMNSVMSKMPSKEPYTLFALEEELEQDPLSFVESSNHLSETILWEYHILYSPSYSVPVLYFNVRSVTGKLLSLEDVWNCLHIPKETLVEKWSFVSQQEHPILLRPYFSLHPCKSYQLLELSHNTNVNPLVTWLSSVAPIVHLNINLEYGQKTFFLPKPVSSGESEND